MASLKRLYSSREVARLTGLSARQLQSWDDRKILRSSVPPRRTERGGFTERRYTPIDLLELMVLADLQRRGFTVGRIRRLLDVLRLRFRTRLYEAIEGGGPVTLFADRDQIYARTEAGEMYNVLEDPEQPLLMIGEQVRLKQLMPRERKRDRGRAGRPTSGSGRPSRDRRRDAG